MFIYFTKVTEKFKNKYKSLKGKEIHNLYRKLHSKTTLFSKHREDQIPVWYQLTINNKVCLSVNL